MYDRDHVAGEHMDTTFEVVSSSGAEFIEEFLPNEVLLKTSSVPYRLGLINMFGAKVGFIINAFFNKALIQGENFLDDESIIVDVQKVKTVPEDTRFSTFKNIYLVKYVPGGTMTNEKTGEEQATIDYEYPVVIVRTFNKKATAYLAIEEEGIRCKTKHGFEYSEGFKQVNAKERSILDESARTTLKLKLAKQLGEATFFFAPSFPDALRRAGIDNYKVFADTIEAFVSENLSPQFDYVRNVEINGKRHPGIIVFVNGRSIGEVLTLLQSCPSKKNSSAAAKKRSLTSDELSRLKRALYERAKAKGLLLGSMIPGIVDQLGLGDYKDYAEDIEDFTKHYVGELFDYKKKYTADGKLYSGVLLLKEIEHQELMFTDSVFVECKPNIDGVKYGVINVCSKKNGFINSEYVNKNVYPKYALDSSSSIIFNTVQVEWLPQDIRINTKENIYLVEFRVSGIILDSKTHKARSAIDYSYPVRIVECFPRSNCVLISVREDRVIIETYKTIREQPVIDENFEQIVEKIKEEILVRMEGRKFIEASKFPIIAKLAGLDDFRKYAENVEAFVHKYFKDLDLKKNVIVNGIKYPGIIFALEDGPDIGEEIIDEQEEKRTEFDLSRLDKMYEDGEYNGYLSSDIVEKINFCDFSIEYMEKTLSCAAHLIFPLETPEIKLNQYQKEVFLSRSTVDFVKKWKHEGKIEPLIVEQCAESSFVPFSLPVHSGYVFGIINTLGRSKGAHNDNYPGLTNRLAINYDKLLPYMFFVRACVQRTHHALERCIGDYVQVIKNFQQAPFYSLVDSKNQLLLFADFLAAVDNNIVKIERLSRLLHTSIISLYVDTGKMKELKDVYQLLSTDKDNDNNRLVKLFDNYENCTEEEVAELFETEVSVQLIQKVVSLIWEKLSDEKELPESFIRLLSWVCLWGDAASVDEAMRYRILNKKFTKLQKMEQLLWSFQKVCSLAQTDISIHILASYIRFVVCEDVTQDSLEETCDFVRDYWGTYSAKMNRRVVDICENLSVIEEKQILRFIHIFWLDISNQMVLQDRYANWYLRKNEIELLTTDDINNSLIELFNNKAYKAYIDLFQRVSDENRKVLKSNLLIEQYAVSLIAMRRYNEAIIFIRQNDSMTEDFRDELTIRVLSEFFKNNGISSNAYVLFGASFSEQDAIDLLLRNLLPNKNAAINSLIAIYCARNEVIKAAYLYQIYHERAERGCTRLYTQIRKSIKSFNAGLKNHYDVIEYAFGVLCNNELIEFLTWAKQIAIPNLKGYTPMHVFSYFYERIISDPQDPKYWQSFYDHIIKRTDVNGWTIVICENILFGLTGVFENRSGSIIHSLMRQGDPDELPTNFLPYVYEYIMNGGNIAVCKAMRSMLSKTGIIEALKINNRWADRYSTVEEQFKVYCIERFGNTGDDVYYDIITLLGMQFNIREIAVLTKTSGDKSYLYQLICRYFLSGRDKSEVTTLLYEEKWSDMTSRDLAVLDILKMLYQSEEVLLDKELFENEDAVYRFKHDCATILSVYPEKIQLNTFDKNCNSIKHKLLVYSYIFRCLYDEDIYHKYELGYEELITDSTLYNIYLKYHTTVLYAQLYWNQDYPFFYKRWRYLKLYIANTLSFDQMNNQKILDAMEEHGHFQLVYEGSYKPFTENVQKFWELSAITEYDKCFLLFSLMIGRVNDFLKKREVAIADIGYEEKRLLKAIVSQLDYREVNLSIYTIYESKIKENRLDEVIRIAEGFSDYAVDSLKGLKKYEDDRKAHVLFESCALQEKPSYVTKSVFRVEHSDFEKYCDMLVPLVCSRQFIFLLYGSTRSTIVNRGKHATELHYIALTEYMSKYRTDEAKAVQKYLLALKACMEGNRAKAKDYIGEADIKSAIPAQWKREGELIYKYANGEIAQFTPDGSISDSSLESERKEIRFAFIEKLKKQYNIQKVSENTAMIKSIYERFVDRETDETERIRSAVELIVNYPRQEKIEEVTLPPRNLLIFMVGSEISDSKFSLDDDEKISVLFELYNGRTLIRGEKKRIKELRNVIIQRLKSGIPLQTWVRYRNAIRELLEEENALVDYLELQKRILNKCAGLMDPAVSQEERYEGLCNLLKLSNDLESIYSRNVFDAIRIEKKAIENGGRLRIEIENANGSTDQKVYFLIRNIGKTAISFAKGDYYVTFRQEGYLEERISINNISDLQSDYITGGNAQLNTQTSNDMINVTLAVKRKCLTDEVDEIICAVSEDIKIDRVLTGMTVNRRNRYDTWNAVVDADMLFGRDKQKKDLEYMIPGGITVIYGPSRIGKTSLMNWIKKKYAIDKGNVMSITIGGEGDLGKDSDYSDENDIDPGKSMPYYDDEKMSEYLLIKTIVYGLTTTRRLKKPSKRNISSEFIQQAVQILQDDSLSIIDRYYELDQKLLSEDVELWLLLDEFQQVVEQWKDLRASCEFVNVCRMLLSPDNGEVRNIKIIICGSDDLLRHMVLKDKKDKSVWRQTFPDYSRLAVEPLTDVPFFEMVRQDKKLYGTGVTYTDAALETLYSYTRGVALYGKEICNAVLAAIERKPEKFHDRTTIYSSDIAEATQKLLNQQAAELDTSERAGILKIYDDVTKNLRADSDMQYLYYIAKWLHDNPANESFPETVFYRNGNLLNEDELHDSLAIADARGILRRMIDEKTGAVSYTFRTIFYYYAFLGMVRNHLDENKIYSGQETETKKNDSKADALSMIAQFDELSESDQGTVFYSLYHQGLSDNARKKFRKAIGDNFEGDNVEGSKIGTQNNVQINIQNMTTALTNIVSGQNLLKSYEQLPKLGTYIAAQLSEQDQGLLRSKREALKQQDISGDERMQIEDEIFEMCSPAVDAMASDYCSAEMNTIINGEYAGDEENPLDSIDENELLGVSRKELEGIRRSLPSKIQMQFDFAIMLHKIFYQLKTEKNIDYCPVAILYCKMVEGLLKERHFEIYARRLSAGNYPKVRIGKQDVDWSYFLDKEGNIDKKKIRRNRKKLSIGSFSFPIGSINDEKDVDSEVSVNEDVIEALATSENSDIANQSELRNWRKHAKLLPWIRVYRNASAHELTPITKEDMNRISSILFKKGEMDLIIELAPDMDK